MQPTKNLVEDYCLKVPIDQANAFKKIREVITTNLPKWFEECINYGMLWYVVPHSLYPWGYHCDSKLPLPFIGLAYQKNSINLYHMGLYTDSTLHERFKSEFAYVSKRKCDMGKSCIRFKWYDDIPYELIGKLVSKITPLQRVSMYEKSLKK